MIKKLTQSYIESLTDAQVYALTIEHPDSPGERAFSFAVSDFDSRAEMAACMALLLARLTQLRDK